MKKEQPQEAEVEEEDLEVASEEDFPVVEASVVVEVIKIVLSNKIFLCGSCILITRTDPYFIMIAHILIHSFRRRL